MRSFFVATLFVCALAMPATVRAQNAQVQGFGGLTFGNVTSSATFGGGIAVPLGGNMQVIAEGGHMSDVMPSLAAALIDLTPVDFGVSATYGEAGIRVFATSNRAVRPVRRGNRWLRAPPRDVSRHPCRQHREYGAWVARQQ